MATFGPSFIASFATTADLSSFSYCIVKMSAAGLVEQSTASTEVLMGVLTDGVANGSSAKAGVSVAITGIAKVRAGAAVNTGQPLTSDGQGRALPAAAGDHIIGRALTDAGGADEIFECLLLPGLIQHA
jgi:hypothetical protein